VAKILTAEERLAIANEGLSALLALVRRHAQEDAWRAVEMTKRSLAVLEECNLIEAFRKGQDPL
jgi:hypothetical protein